MTNNVINYYVSGNTAKGFHSLLETNISGIRLIVINGNYQLIKSNLMKSMSDIWRKRGYNLEILHCASNNDYIEGVINRDIGVGIIDGNDRHKIDSSLIDTMIDTDSTLEKNSLVMNIEDIIYLEDKIIDNYKKAYEYFENALKVHDEWEEIYISNMNRLSANSYSDAVINNIISNTIIDKKADVKHRFFGAATPNGPIDFIENITSNVQKRYFIKGRPGTGKSTLLKRLVKKASSNGIDVEVYHCGFDPNSLDMVILRELDIVIFDSTAPHEYYPSRENDEVIDMYAKIIAQGTDEKYEDELNSIIERYKYDVDEATHYLKTVKKLNDKIETYYSKAFNSNKFESIKENLISIILKYEKK
ncbi:hypothetical protein RJG79_12140 [Mycoplasmatota bacterium WC44]